MGTLKRFAPIFATLAVAATSALAANEPGNLAPGAPAPELSIKRWVKGKPVKSFDKNKTYVVEFWATWCGPCRDAMPHVSELAKKNRDVTFIGVGIWEDDVDGKIDAFVKEMGKKADYNLAYSGNQDGMAESWMKPFGQNGIPASFIVKGGKVQWVGHPMSMDKPLAEIKAGTFDVEAFKVAFEKEAAENRLQMEMRKELKGVVAQFDAGKRDEAKVALTALVEKYPKSASEAESIRFGWLATEDPAAWETKAVEMAKDKKTVMQIVRFAMSKAEKPAGHELARKALAIALDGSERKNFSVLWYAANIYGMTGDYKLGIEAVDQAADLYPTSEAKDIPQYKEYLAKQKEELQKKLAAAG
ncbi:TlpA family protein disulfide reductase [bacterium]|nr:MAG: TlpA family protein disulfide reductase [bacterium]